MRRTDSEGEPRSDRAAGCWNGDTGPEASGCPGGCCPAMTTGRRGHSAMGPPARRHREKPLVVELWGARVGKRGMQGKDHRGVGPRPAPSPAVEAALRRTASHCRRRGCLVEPDQQPRRPPARRNSSVPRQNPPRRLRAGGTPPRGPWFARQRQPAPGRRAQHVDPMAIARPRSVDETSPVERDGRAAFFHSPRCAQRRGAAPAPDRGSDSAPIAADCGSGVIWG